MEHQPELIQPEHLCPRLRWEKLFAFLPPWPEAPATVGRKPCDRNALLKAALYQRLTRRRFLQDLRRHLLESPAMLAALGFDPYQEPPSLERLSSFLADTPHAALETIRVELTQRLLQAGAIPARRLGFDSCPIASWVRENNLKTSLHSSRFDKNVPPKGDPDARLGVRIHYPFPDKSEVEYLLGLSQSYPGGSGGGIALVGDNSSQFRGGGNGRHSLALRGQQPVGVASRIGLL